MKDDTRQIIPFGGLLATIGAAAYMVAQLNGQAPALTGDFTGAATAQVRDAQGQIVLQGQFTPPAKDDGGFERSARLDPTGITPGARGEAEVEFGEGALVEQEVEFSVAGLPAGAALTFAIDGTDVATATTDARGHAEIELTVRQTR